jgi:hypothetical protein
MKRPMTNRLACIAMAAVLLASCLAAAGPVRASDVPPDDAEIEGPLVRDTASVTVDGHVLFQVRGVSAHPAAVRAQAISERIKMLAADAGVSPESLRVEETEGRSEIRAGDDLIMSVYDADAALADAAAPVLAEPLRPWYIGTSHDRTAAPHRAAHRRGAA